MESHRSSQLLLRTLKISRELILLADEGEAEATDDGCRILFGVVRDSGYRIRSHAESECQAHREKGIWDAEDSSLEERDLERER